MVSATKKAFIKLTLLSDANVKNYTASTSGKGICLRNKQCKCLRVGVFGDRKRVYKDRREVASNFPSEYIRTRLYYIS